MKSSYTYYKNKYKGKVILFRLEGEFCALHDDAQTIFSVLKNNALPKHKRPNLMFWECRYDNDVLSVYCKPSEVLDFIGDLYELGVECVLVEHRDSTGRLTIPDTSLIQCQSDIDKKC